MVHPDTPLSDADRRRLAALHLASLPTAMFSRLGLGVLESYYAFVERSDAETLFVLRHQGTVAAAAVLSMEGRTLLRRFVLGNPFRFATRVTLSTFTDSSFRRQFFTYLGERLRSVDSEEDLPEVLQIYADAAMRGGGMGSELMSLAERSIADAGQAVITVRTLADHNEATLRFYRRLGYDPFRNSVFCGDRYVRLRKVVGTQ